MRRALPWCLAIYWSALALAMHWPSEGLPGASLHPWDKAVHGTAYAVLTLLVLLVSERFDSRGIVSGTRRTARTCLCVLLVVAYGLLDEVTQPLTGRGFDLRDLAADAAGATCVALAYLVLRPLFSYEA